MRDRRSKCAGNRWGTDTVAVFEHLQHVGGILTARRIAASWLAGLALIGLAAATGSAHRGSALGSLMFVAGLAMAAVASVGRLWCSLYIGGYKDARLVTTGPYSLTRNPLYFFSLVGFAGIGLATQSFTLTLGVLLAFALAYPAVIAREERVLRARFGIAFDRYCRCTPRFLPTASKYLEPERYVVSPRAFRRAAADAIWFVWLAGLVHLMAEHRVVPALLTLP
jgi:protein-S-isoprenylcysteine O-methyltransferase Ste14